VIRRISLAIFTTLLVVAGAFVLLVLIGLFDRYQNESAALGFAGIYERLAWEVGLSSDPRGATGINSRRARQVNAREQLVSVRSYRIPKLIGHGAIGEANQGTSVALSADGTTAIVGGPGPNNADRDRSPRAGPAGAAWVFTRNGGVWTQQGGRLVGTTADFGGGLWSQGMSVALSANGGTAIIGGPSDNKTTGAAWVFVRSDGVWTQQGNKLVGKGAHGEGDPVAALGQGMSVALSANGDTAIIGAWRTDAAWVFTRSGDVWTQQGNRLVGSGAIGSARQGISVALSADGNTAIVGGWFDNSKAGATWVFTRKGGVWSQQGKKLVGSGAVGSARQGTSVALSADGNTAIVGAPGDNPSNPSAPFGTGATGAAWVFTRNNGPWTQQSDKLVATNGFWTQQGASVALSADGSTAVVGGFAEDRNAGGALVFVRANDKWKQREEVIGHNNVGRSASAIALSSDASMILLGEPHDDGGVGAVRVFTRSSAGAY
jgi:hypothetical protein